MERKNLAEINVALPRELDSDRVTFSPGWKCLKSKNFLCVFLYMHIHIKISRFR